jgi:hypothetical protein
VTQRNTKRNPVRKNVDIDPERLRANGISDEDIKILQDLGEAGQVAYELGITEGRAQARKELLDWLEEEFMKPEVDMLSVWGRSILEIAKKAATHFRELTYRGE